ncbi:MAG: hypothetical protein ABIH72_02070 [archaeon]
MKITVLKGKKREKFKKMHFSIDKREVAVYETFKEKVGNPCSVLYPACGFNISPSEVFNNITFVDPNPNVYAALTVCGFESFWECIQDYRPKAEHDLLVLQGFYSELIKETLRFVAKEGHILIGPFNPYYLGSIYDQAEIIQNEGIFSCYGEINFVDREDKNNSRTRFTRSLDGKLTRYNTKHQGRVKLGADWYIFKKDK